MFSLSTTRLFTGNLKSPLLGGGELKALGTLQSLVETSKEIETPSSDEVSLSNAQSRPRSLLIDSINRLTSLTNQIEALQKQKESFVTEDIKNALSKEIEALTNEFHSITTSGSFASVASTVHNKLYGVGELNGGAAESLSDLFANGDISRIQLLDRSLTSLQSFDTAALSAGATTLENVREALRGVIDSVTGLPPAVTPQAQKAELPQTTITEIPLPSLQKFDLPGELSIAFQSYSTRDLLLAAQAGIQIDPKQLVQIMYDVPGDERNKIEDPSQEENLIIETTEEVAR